MSDQTLSPGALSRLEVLKRCAPKRVASYGSNPWAIVHEPTGAHIEGPPEIHDFGDALGRRQIMGQIYFSRKRDAIKALADLMHACSAGGKK